MNRWFLLFAVVLAGCTPVDNVVELEEPDDEGTTDGAFPAYEAALSVPEDGVQIHLKPFWLGAGNEKERCWFVQAPNNMPATIKKMEIVARPGLHHSILIKSDERFDDHKEDCFGFPLSLVQGLENGFPSPLMGTSTQVYEETVEFPEGVGTQIQGGQQLILNFHYLNAGTEQIPAEVWVNLHFAEPGEVQEYADTYFFGNINGIDMDPQTGQKITSECDLPSEVKVVSMTPHMHQRGTQFTAVRKGESAEEEMYNDVGWFDPRTEVFSPAVPFTGTDRMRFTCEWENDTDRHVRFGETTDDEMCFTFGHFYPAFESLFAFEGYGCDEVENQTWDL